MAAHRQLSSSVERWPSGIAGVSIGCPAAEDTLFWPPPTWASSPLTLSGDGLRSSGSSLSLMWQEAAPGPAGLELLLALHGASSVTTKTAEMVYVLTHQMHEEKHGWPM